MLVTRCWIPNPGCLWLDSRYGVWREDHAPHIRLRFALSSDQNVGNMGDVPDFVKFCPTPSLSRGTPILLNVPLADLLLCSPAFPLPYLKEAQSILLRPFDGLRATEDRWSIGHGAKAANSLNVTLPPHLASPAREEETKKALVPAESRAEVSYK